MSEVVPIRRRILPGARTPTATALFNVPFGAAGRTRAGRGVFAPVKLTVEEVRALIAAEQWDRLRDRIVEDASGFLATVALLTPEERELAATALLAAVGNTGVVH